jgi:hypothetical protein
MEFAMDNELPFKITNEQGTFSASSDKYKDYESFKNDVLTYTGAKDLQNNLNTIPINSSAANAGDIILNRNSQNIATHAQQITYKNSLGIIGIHQGNSGLINIVPGASRIFAAGNPTSLFYTGKPVEIGIYIPKLDFYKNYSTGNIYENYSKLKNIEFRRWNFTGMNSSGAGSSW